MLEFKIKSLQKLSMITPPLTQQINDITTKNENSSIKNSKRDITNVKEDQILF